MINFSNEWIWTAAVRPTTGFSSNIISTRKRWTCQKCMNTSTIKLLTLSFRRRSGSCPFRWELSTQSRETWTILGRLNLFYISCKMMSFFFSKFKSKEIKKCLLSRKNIFCFQIFWVYAISSRRPLHGYVTILKKTINNMVNFFYVENSEWHQLP